VLQLGAKGCEGWSSTNITPTGFTVATYDIVVAGVQSLIAVACKKRDDAGTGHQLFFSSMNLTHLEDNLTSLMSKDGVGQFLSSRLIYTDSNYLLQHKRGPWLRSTQRTRSVSLA
jgi:hypothetical protein